MTNMTRRLRRSKSFQAIHCYPCLNQPRSKYRMSLNTLGRYSFNILKLTDLCWNTPNIVIKSRSRTFWTSHVLIAWSMLNLKCAKLLESCGPCWCVWKYHFSSNLYKTLEVFWFFFWCFFLNQTNNYLM